MAATRSNVLFISHNAADRPYAVALEEAIHALVESRTLIDVRYSTSDEAGPQGGEKWREWIHRQVVEARTALIVVTPHALGKPWLLWEAGACRGAALAQAASGDGKGERLVISVAYGLTENECPDPLRGDQIILGAHAERARYLFRRLLEAHDVPPSLLLGAGERMQPILDRYLSAVRTALLQSPSVVNEANVQDWLARLQALVRENRLAELPDFERWMMLAFGRDDEGAAVPIDVRLHRRLGELYLGQRDYARACTQLTLARRAAPRDIFVLRPLGEARMKQLLGANDVDAAAREDVESVLAAIEDLDPRAFVASPDAAALYGKYVRRVLREPARAAGIYARAFEANHDSYYLADLLAQTELECGRIDDAKRTYRRVLDIVARLAQPNVWSHASAAAAHLVLGDPDAAHADLRMAGAIGTPSPRDIESISQGLREVAQRAGVGMSIVEEVLAGLAATQTGAGVSAREGGSA